MLCNQNVTVPATQTIRKPTNAGVNPTSNPRFSQHRPPIAAALGLGTHYLPAAARW